MPMIPIRPGRLARAFLVPELPAQLAIPAKTGSVTSVRSTRGDLTIALLLMPGSIDETWRVIISVDPGSVRFTKWSEIIMQLHLIKALTWLYDYAEAKNGS